MNCIMKKCAHQVSAGKATSCDVLGECGCAYVPARAREPGGYEVIACANPTFNALKHAGLITEHGFDGQTVTIKAAVARPAKERAA